ncbi:MAG TPA: T9SS type A sorting domain-containing protein [Candidatus Krumholzibacteria bacterium]|nr:T9SS type A sorting domain-containing protein [Candidatus Krumholzibacteria bacterium]
MRDRLAFCSLALFSLLSSTTAFAVWTPDGVAVSTAVKDQWVPTSVSDGAGGAIVTWQDFRSGTDWDIYVQRVNAAGVVQWAANGVPICTADHDQLTPTITSDGAGGAIVTWHDARTFPAGAPISIYAQRVNASGVAQWTANGVSLCTTVNNRVDPTITGDGAGGAIVTWEDYRSGGANSDIYAQRVNASGVVQWSANGVVLCAAATDQLGPMIISDNAGGAIVAWYDLRNGIDDDIYAQRVNNLGAVVWIPNGVAVCAAAGSQFLPTLASDAANGAIITWEDLRSGNYDVYAQRVSAAGATLWTANGVGLCTAVDSQGVPTIVSDGVGGAIVTWYDSRSGIDTDIYAQRMNAAGVVQWTANGVALCTAAANQFNPAIVPDTFGGAIVTWRDRRSGTSYDMYAQRVNGSGVAQWIANGVPLCTAVGDQSNYTIISDGAAGAIVAWEDQRGSDHDVYAQQVSAGGVVGQPPTAVGDTPSIAALTVLANSPNPFSATTELEIGLRTASDIHVEIFDVLGRRVNTLDVKEANAGWQRVPFSGHDANGHALASGVYFYRVHANGATVTRKMVITR